MPAAHTSLPAWRFPLNTGSAYAAKSSLQSELRIRKNPKCQALSNKGCGA